MADSAPTKVVDASGQSLSVRAKSLSVEIANPNRRYAYGEDAFDVHQIVLDSCIARSELRIIENSDDEVEQCIETRLDTLQGVDWRLDGGSDEANAWITEQLKLHYETLVNNAFAARLYGYNVMERVWGKDVKGRWIVTKLLEKPFEWFTPKRDGTLWYRPEYSLILPGTAGQWSPDGIQLDTSLKFLLTRHKPTYKNPRGKALLAYLFWPWFYRKATWQFWMQFLERSAQPLLVGKGPNPAQMAEQLAQAVQDAVIGIPLSGDVEAVGGNNKGEAFGLAEERLVKRIQKILLGQTLTSDSGGQGGSGAKALGSVHEEVRQDKTVGDLKVCYPTVQNFVDAYRMLNFPSSRPIKLVYAVERGLEQARANRDSVLINTGTIEFTPAYWMREYGFQKDDFKIIKGGKKNSQPGQDSQGSDNNNSDQGGNSSQKKDDDENDD